MSRLVKFTLLASILFIAPLSTTGCAVEPEDEDLDEDVAETAEVESALVSGAAFKVLTYNLRYQQDVDTGPKRWARRKASVFARIRAHSPDIFGVQEAKRPKGDPDYPAETKAALRDVYDVFDAGGGSPKMIFWKRSRFSFVAGGEEDLPAAAKEGDCGDKVAVWARLHDRRNGRRYFVVNTHLAVGDACKKTREESAVLIKKLVNAQSLGLPAVIFGDLNTDPNDPGQPDEDTIDILAKRGRNLDRVYAYAGKTTPARATFDKGWGKDVADSRHLDHVFFDPRLARTARRIDRTKNADGISPSDHYPVIAVFAPR